MYVRVTGDATAWFQPGLEKRQGILPVRKFCSKYWKNKEFHQLKILEEMRIFIFICPQIF